MVFEYETLSGIRRKRSILFISDFTPEESNGIIINLVERIERYGQNRNMQKYYDRIMTGVGERIVRATMNSEDGVVQGVITYVPPNFLTEANAEINATFDFISDDKSLKPEYQGLAKILRKM